MITAQSSSDKPVAIEIVSEKLVDALRGDRIDEFTTTSVYAACLLPLLKELGWNNYARELVEALPHFSEQFDLVDLRNILVTLGYESTPMTSSIRAVKPELYPCLFQSEQGELYVLTSCDDDLVTYFDATKQQVLTGNILGDEGTVYVFTDTGPSHVSAPTGGGQENWFNKLLQRFRGMVFHLLMMTFVINLVALSIPLFIMLIYDKVIGAKSPDTLPYLVAGIIILVIADLVLRYLRAKLLGSVAGRLDYLIGVETFRQMICLPPIFTERSTVAAQLSRLKQFDSVRDFFTGPNAAIALELPFVILFIGVIALLGGAIAFVPLTMVLGFFILGVVWLPTLDEKILRSGKARTDKQRILMQTLAGRKEIKAIGGETVWWERFREISGESVMANYNTFVSSGVMNSVAQGMVTLSGLAVLTLGTLAVMEGEMSIGALIAIMALVWRVLSPLQSAFLSFSKFEQTLKAIQQINQLMKLKVETKTSHAGLLQTELRGEIHVDRVSFRYSPEQDPALLGVSFDVRPGEMVAVVGHTGSGKSTMLKLIAGMYRPQAGALLFDQQDLRQLNAMELRRAIAYVPQATKLFHGTIAQNMRLNNGLATDEDLRRAASDAGVLEEILALSDGFDTRIGDNQTERLPPGFLRSLAMARAFTSPARILLLDEPGASLDYESDLRFVKHLKQLRGKRTIIMVSHRPSHIRLADKVVLMDQGVVRFLGPAEEAVKQLMGFAA
ncbi:MAG: ATP-binding cassette domain-containing protein [Gammaproteobacteria bacterium]|nr:ATP-binding cassette domain-containing protein [Gammaproteobacteria bacterium]